MTEAVLTHEMPMTPLAATLAEGGIPFGSYRGVKTVERFERTDSPIPATQALDAPDSETDALLCGAGVQDLGWMRRIAVRGEDRFRWLSGMVTNGVDTLEEGRGAYNLVLNAQGRIQGDCYVWRRGEGLEIEVTAEQREALLGHFDKFIIMDDVELVPLEEECALGLAGPQSDRVLDALGVPKLVEPLSSVVGRVSAVSGSIDLLVSRDYGAVVPHYTLWTGKSQIRELWMALLAAGAIAVGAEAVETLRVVEGVPAYGIDMQSRDLAQETSQLRALSFTKGCYLGQEIVERVRSRGQVHRHLRQLEIEPASGNCRPAVGTELRVQGSAPDSKPGAQLTSVTRLTVAGRNRVFAIAMVREEAEVGGRALVYDGGTARILQRPPADLVSG